MIGVGIQPFVIPALKDHSEACSVFQVHIIQPDYKDCQLSFPKWRQQTDCALSTRWRRSVMTVIVIVIMVVIVIAALGDEGNLILGSEMALLIQANSPLTACSYTHVCVSNDLPR